MQYIDIVNLVLGRLNEVRLTTDNWGTVKGFHNMAKDSINAALWDINNQDFEWPFNHVTTTLPLTPMTQIYALPDDVKSVDWDTFFVTANAPAWGASELPYIDYDEWCQTLRANDLNATAGGVPQNVFRTQGMQFGVTPPPDQAYVVEFEYWTPYIALSDPADVPTVPDQYIPVLIDGAMYYVYQFRENIDAATEAKTKFEAGIKTMRTILINRYTDVRSGQIPGRG
jgi:hypothetical protein